MDLGEVRAVMSITHIKSVGGESLSPGARSAKEKGVFRWRVEGWDSSEIVEQQLRFSASQKVGR